LPEVAVFGGMSRGDITGTAICNRIYIADGTYPGFLRRWFGRQSARAAKAVSGDIDLAKEADLIHAFCAYNHVPN
jgi:hypothetical protein